MRRRVRAGSSFKRTSAAKAAIGVRAPAAADRICAAEEDVQQNAMRQLLHQARLLLMDFEEVHFDCLVRIEGGEQDGELKVLCARPTELPPSQSIMDLYLIHADGSKELGALLPGGSGDTGALYHCYGTEQEGGHRRLRRKHLLEFFAKQKVRWIGPQGTHQNFSVKRVTLTCVTW